MTVNNLKQITIYKESGREFVILQDEFLKFWAIENKYIDKNGRLTQEVNGLTGLRSESEKEAIQKAHERIVYQNLIAQGMSKEDALMKLFDEEF